MILSTLVTSQLHFEMCAGLYGHPVYLTIIVKSNQLRVLLESYGQSGASLLFRLALASQLYHVRLLSWETDLFCKN